MAKPDLFTWDVVAANNTDVNSINLAEGMQRNLVNNAMREIMAEVKRELANQGTGIASAGTCNIAATGTSGYVHITGSTGPITSFGTVAAGTHRWLVFDSTPTITYNATSMILIGNANRVIAAGDTGLYVSEGSGNWREVAFFRDDGSFIGTSLSVSSTAAGTLLTLTSTDAGTGSGPDVVGDRNSATPAALDGLMSVIFRGRDSGSNATDYAKVRGIIFDPTNGSEDGLLALSTVIAGAMTDVVVIGTGVSIGGATDKGAGTLNANGLYVAGHGTIAQVVSNTNAVYTTCGTIMPYDNTIPQITEGDEILSVAITPVNSSSILRIRVILPVVGTSAAQTISAALFVDATANALAAGATRASGGSAAFNISFEFSVSAASLTARTYRVRMGAASATDAFLNGDDTGRIFGGVSIASLEVTEILPQ